MTENKVYDFGEKYEESYKTKDGWKILPVVHHAKYKTSKAKAIELIESKKYGLEESDFWILKNSFGQDDKMKLYYTGLIISHNGCLKINDILEDKLKFDPESVSFLKDERGEKVMQYINKEQKVYEFGEISPANCKNDYPYAMVLKRLMDRVILKNSKIGFFGIYSEAESDSFKEQVDIKENKIPKGLAEEANNNLKSGNEEKRLADLAKALEDMGSVAEIDAYLEVTYKGKTRLQVLRSMSAENAGQAETIIRNAKYRIDPEGKY